MFRALFNDITCNEPKKLIRPAIWNTFASIANLIPFGCLAYIVKQIYTHIQDGSPDRSSLWLAFGLMVLFTVVTYFLENIACKVTYHDGFFASAEGRIRLAEHIRKLPLGILTGKSSGEIGNTMMNDFSRTETALTHILPQIISGFLVAVIASAVMLIADWRMGLACFAGFPLSVMIMLSMKRLETSMALKLNASASAQSAGLIEYLTGMKTIKAYHMQGENFGKLRQVCTEHCDNCIRSEGRIGSLNLFAAMLLRCGLPLMMTVGVHLLAGGTLQITTFAMFLLLGTRIFDPLAVAIMNWSELNMCAAAGQRITKLLDEPVMEGREKAPEQHDFTVENVSFGYGDTEVLNGVSAAFPSGTMSALVGPSGSGKSTMLKLLARFYDPTSGTVRMGGISAKDVDPEQWMQNISFVFQDVYLFQDTVAGNIAYGKENATRAEIEQAAKAANCYDFIMEMPDGFDSMIGEGGCTLSGGEKQRISIARAMLKNAPVLLLDEATASLDPENEAQIQQAINRLADGKTVIVIAHKLKTVANADQILVFENGQITESGKHDALLAQNGLYARLWNIQNQSGTWKIHS